MFRVLVVGCQAGFPNAPLHQSTGRFRAVLRASALPDYIFLQLFRLYSMCALLYAYRRSVGLPYHLVHD